MTKDDLQTGILVQLRQGEIYLLVNGVFISASHGHLLLTSYRLDLTHVDGSSDWDIIKVSHKLDDWRLARQCWEEGHLFEMLRWSRDDWDEVIKEPKPAKKIRSEYFDIAENQWKSG